MALEDLPEYPEFRKVSIEDRDWVGGLLDRHPSDVSERTFCSIFIWRSYEDRSMLSRLGEHLLISWRREKFGRVLLPPIGSDPANAILELAGPRLSQHLTFNGVFAITEPLASGVRLAGKTPEPLRDEWDYVYLRDDLVRLEGPGYHTQRKEMKKATSSLALEYLPMSADLRGQCLELQEKWCDLRHCSMDRLSKEEDVALKEALLNYDILGLTGAVVTVDGRVQALTIGERLTSDTAVVHFEKANPEIRGLYQVINHRFCEHALDGYMFVNREQDVGEPGLRRAKEGYRPHHFVEKHFLSFR